MHWEERRMLESTGNYLAGLAFAFVLLSFALFVASKMYIHGQHPMPPVAGYILAGLAGLGAVISFISACRCVQKAHRGGW